MAKKKKHSQRQGHPARRQQARQGIIEATSIATTPNQGFRLGYIDWFRGAAFLLAAELIVVLIFDGGDWVLPAAGSLWCAAVLLPLMLQRSI